MNQEICYSAPHCSSIQVGILHSLSGTLAISEASLKDAALMAIAEINQAGGVLGKIIEPVIVDGESEPAVFEQKARQLIQDHQVATIFGCWSSTGRKLVLPVLEENNVLLWYPVQYEGLECSKQVFYTGACPNQQVEPAVRWLLENKGKRFYLLGMNYVFPRVSNKIIKAQLKEKGGMVVGETYPPLGATDFNKIIQDIQRSQAEVVFSTLNGDSNLSFYQQYRAAGITAADIPVMAVSVSEQELRYIGAVAAGHYAAWTYFQSIDTPQNQDFVRKFKAMYGSDRVTSDPIESAYFQVYLWKQAVEQAQSFEVDQVRTAAYGQTFAAPGGPVKVEHNHHIWKDFYIGEMLTDGQFNIVFASNAPIKPQPWLGIESSNFEGAALIVDLLAEVSGAVQANCQLEQKSWELQSAMQELVETNQKLQQTQTQLQELTQREDLFKRRLSSQIRNSLELNTVLETAVHEIRYLLNIDRCRFLRWQGRENGSEEVSLEAQSPTFVQTHIACADGLTLDTVQHSHSIAKVLGNIVLNTSLLCLDDVKTDTLIDTSSRCALTSLGITSLLAIAIRTRSGQIGIVVCEHDSNIRVWDESEVELLKDVADQIAIAIDQANLYEQSRTTATIAQVQAQQLEQALAKLQQTQAQLIQTEKMSGLGQLVAGVAHEINNPVNFIFGNLSYTNDYVQNLLRLVQLYQTCYPNPVTEIEAYANAIDFDFLAEDLPKILTSMKVGADRIRQIVLSLRNFSRLDEADMKLVNIHEGIDSTLLILQHRLKSKPGYTDITVIKDYGDLPLVECYAGQLNQVFMNILTNAIDAIEEASEQHNNQLSCPIDSTPYIKIQTQLLQPDRIVIQISDNGPGMTETVRARLFDPFFTTKPTGQGTGLGLSISYQIVVEKHKGMLHCESEPGKGALFWIEIPLRQSDSSS